MDVMLMAASLFLASVTVVSPLAGVLEAPGDPQLSRSRYLAAREIYYPGFALAGIAEPLSILALCVLLASLSHATAPFWLAALALAAEMVAHILYWLLIVPRNGVWLASETHPSHPRSSAPGDRIALQDRWERSHAGRAVLSAAAFVLLVAATCRAADVSGHFRGEGFDVGSATRCGSVAQV
jgi:hypothetical protein